MFKFLSAGTTDCFTAPVNFLASELKSLSAGTTLALNTVVAPVLLLVALHQVF